MSRNKELKQLLAQILILLDDELDDEPSAPSPKAGSAKGRSSQKKETRQPKATVRDIVLDALKKGPATVTHLRKEVSRRRGRYTRYQQVYWILRDLATEGVVVRIKDRPVTYATVAEK